MLSQLKYLSLSVNKETRLNVYQLRISHYFLLKQHKNYLILLKTGNILCYLRIGSFSECIPLLLINATPFKPLQTPTPLSLSFQDSFKENA